MNPEGLASRDIIVYEGAPAARRGWMAVGAACLLTMGTFILLPFSDLLAPPSRDLLELRPVSLSPPRRPPPPALPKPMPVKSPLPAPAAPPAPIPLDVPPAPTPPAKLDLPQVAISLTPPDMPLDTRLDFAVRVPPPATQTTEPEVEPGGMVKVPPTTASSGNGNGTAPAGASTAVATDEGEVAVDRMPELIKSAEPLYPPRARRQDLEGYVVVRFTVTAEGETRELEIIDASPRQVFVEAATDAVLKWRYRPATKDGNPVPVRMQVRIRFRLE